MKETRLALARVDLMICSCMMGHLYFFFFFFFQAEDGIRDLTVTGVQTCALPISEFSVLNHVPITIHTAESPSEHELLTQGTGFFTDVYKKYGVEWYSPHSTPIEIGRASCRERV